MFPITCNAVGDIVVLATFVLDIARALSESSGSTSEYRSCIAELNSLHVVLASVARVAEYTADIGLQDEIVREAAECAVAVERVLERVAKFSLLDPRDSLKGMPLIRMKRLWYKLEWRFSQRGRVNEFRAELAVATQRLTAYLAVLNADAANTLRESLTQHFNVWTADVCSHLLEQFAVAGAHDVRVSPATSDNPSIQRTNQPESAQVTSEFGTTLEGMDSGKTVAVALLCVAICTVHDTPQAVHTALLLAAVCLLLHGMTRNSYSRSRSVGYCPSNSMVLFDALGRRLILPLELCETYESFHATLLNLFSQSKGRWFVDRYRYELLDRTRGDTVSRESWKGRMLPGQQMEMYVLVQQMSDTKRRRIECPWCFAMNTNDQVPSSRDIVCKQCSRCFANSNVPWQHSSAPYRASYIDDVDVAFQTHINFDDWGVYPRSRAPLVCEKIDNAPKGEVSPVWQTQIRDLKRIHVFTVLPPNLWVTKTSCRSELHRAAENDHAAFALALLEKGEDIDSRAASGHTALHCAATHGYLRIISLLIDYGAAIDALADDDATPLACAVMFHQREAASLLLARGAIVNASDRAKAVVLYAAAGTDDVDTAQVLIRLGVDVNTRFANENETALHVAAESGRSRLVEVLLRHGADVKARTTGGKTPLLLASERGHRNVVTMLLESGAV
ncbi:unnamed protein product [Peniophora sp. CBMAI 1063]|nr:unnamed protein product [Peniophora sp. CBMAI 1063]